MAGLVKTMKAYQKASLAKSSRRSYRVGLRHYRKFCKSFRYIHFPPSQLTLRLFVTHLANTVSFKSIKLYLSVVKFKAVELGFRNNFHKMSQLHLLLRGIKRKLGSTVARKLRPPITPELLKLIKSHMRKKVFPRSDSTMLWSACFLAFFGFLHSSDNTSTSTQSFHQATTLQFQDMNLDDSTIHLTVKASKTDPFRESVTLLVASTGTSLCPVPALKHYLKYSKVSQGQLFQFSDGRFLTQTPISRTVREALSNQGLDIKRYSPHSFRIGAASTASAAGLSDSLKIFRPLKEQFLAALH